MSRAKLKNLIGALKGSSDAATRVAKRLERNLSTNASNTKILALGHLYKPVEQEVKKAFDDLSNVSTTDKAAMKEAVRRFWRIAKKAKDPIADLALNLTEKEWDFSISLTQSVEANRGNSVNISTSIPGNKWAESTLNRAFAIQFEQANPVTPSNREVRYRGNNSYRRPNRQWLQARADYIQLMFRRVQVEIAKRHWEEALRDEKGRIWGLLDSGTITRYHHDVFFDVFQIPKSTFTGTLFSTDESTGLNRFLADHIWCIECDDFIPDTQD